MKMRKHTLGYCDLCRQYEIEKLGTLAYASCLMTRAKAEEMHEECCKKAGCRHPAVYRWEETTK